MTQQTESLKKLFGELYAKLMSFTLEQEFLQDLGESLEVFYNLHEGDEYEFIPTEEFMFLTWFLLDDTTPDGYSLMDEFLKRNADNLSLTETQICKALKETTLSLYQIKKVVPGESMSLRDVFTGENIQTPETTGTEDLTTDTLLFTRVLKLGETSFLVGAGIFLDSSVTEPLTKYITDQFQECCESGNHMSFKDFLKGNGEMINWWIRAYESGEFSSDEDDEEENDDNNDDKEDKK